MNELQIVILAGGAGTRLWPLSRRDRPKPFVSIDGGASLLRGTWERARLLTSPKHIRVASEERLAAAIRRELPELEADNLLAERVPRDTGPAALWATWLIERRRPGSVLALLPADHRIARQDRFVEAVAEATRIAAREPALVCLAIPATAPSASFGYLEFADGPPQHGRAERVARFREKPDAPEAESLLREGRCAWNAGIFVWRAETFLHEVRRQGGGLARALSVLETEGPERFFQEAHPGPVDRLVMEQCDRTWAVGADMGWDDVGSWTSVAAHLPEDDRHNHGVGRWIAEGATGCIVHSTKKPVVLLGAKDLIVVERDDVLLVARREDAERIRDLPDLLEAGGLGHLR